MIPELSARRGPLSGITVVEFAGIGPAPFAGMMFADMGANVILVERKSGSSIQENEETHPRHYEIYHRNKRSIALDLKSVDSIDLILDFIKTADILIEGFRPGVMERLGLSPDICFGRKSDLIYGRMTGWGQSGPMAKMAGHEPNYLSISGAFHYARHGEFPWSPMTFGGDVGAGSTLLAWGCLSALFEAKMNGVGRVVDAAILDGAIYNSAIPLMLRNSGQIPKEAGQSWFDGAAPWSDVYKCADGRYISLCALEPKFYAELIQRLGLSDNDLFAEQWNKPNWPKMSAFISDLFLTKTREEWTDHFGENDACFAPVLTFEEAQNHPQNHERKMFRPAPGGSQPAIAPQILGFEPVFDLPPLPGQHSVELLKDIGRTANDIEVLSQAGVI